MHERMGRGVWNAAAGLLGLLILMTACCAYGQQDDQAVTDATQGETVLDRVIAVVNNQVVLASDLDLEMRMSRLLPVGDGRESTPEQSLERLTTRALIEQQVVQEDPHGMEIAAKDVEENLAELRQNLPGCKHQDCHSAAGWKAYLATLDLTPERVSDYWSNRMAVLRFIERRFRSGIRISAEEIQKYYQETLVPRYAQREDAPALERVAPRIQEILLQQQVNALMNDWLKSLQDQGQVEILDESLRPAAAGNGGGQ
jgi:peptidyl-prolyl cis-trans isomerase SurA